jgi:hypothetical protein
MSLKVNVSVASVLALLEGNNSPAIIALVGEAMGQEVTNTTTAPAPVAAAAPSNVDSAPQLRVSADKLAEFLTSDPRFQRRSRKSAADFFGVQEEEISKTINSNTSRFRSRNSTRGLGLLIELA